MGKVIVLGWDGLDAELIEGFGLGGRFGLHQTKIETFCNEHVGEPHTMELWPSMVTGVMPDEHGVYAATDSDGVEWDNPIIDLAADVANGIVPQPWLTAIGAGLRDRGIGVNQVDAEYYDQRGVSTVFDGRNARPISIPNYQTPFDEQHGLDADRGRLWQALDVNRKAGDGILPRVDMSRVYDELGSELGARVGLTLQAMHASHDIVWTWFGVLDSVGHIQPAVDAPLQRDWYETAAAVTETVRGAAPPEATVLAVSDHGLQDGSHTHYATLCSHDPAPAADIDGVTDIREWVDEVCPRGDGDVRGGVDAEGLAGVTETLEDLGYV